MDNQPLIKQGWVRALIFIIIFLVINIALAGVAESLLAGGTGDMNAPGGPANGESLMENSLLIRLLFSFFASLLLVFLFRKLLDRKTFASLGFKLKGNVAHAATGFFLGLLLLGTGSLLLIAGNYLEWIDIRFDANSLFISFCWIFCAALAEELVFRGYVLGNLMDSLNKWIALAVSAALFAFFHRQNPSVSPIGFFNLFLGGLLLGINFIYTRNLWFGILLHFTWNFYQGPILGYKVSGLELQSLLQQDLRGNELLTGGNFGFEGSALDGILSLLAVLLLAWMYERQTLQGRHHSRPAG